MAKLLALRQHASSIRLVSLQFLTFAAVGMAWPYLNLFLVDVGFSGTAIGTLASIGAVMSLVLTPLLNRIADALQMHRSLLIIYLLGFALALAIFGSSRAQALVIAAVLLMRITVSPSITLTMQMTMTQLLRQGKAILGQMRAYAALGFTIASLMAGAMFAVGGFPLLFWSGAALVLLSVQMSTVFPAKPKQRAPAAKTEKPPRNRGFYVLMISQFFILMGIRNTFQFMFIHFNENLGIANADIGMWAAILSAVEIPFLVLMDAILPRVRIRIAYIVSALGLALFTLLLGGSLSMPALVLIIIFRGVCWPALHLSSYMLVSEISHPSNVATNQAILQVTMPAIAMLLTGSLFGWVYDHLGAGLMFGLCALVGVVGACIMIAGFRLFDARPGASSADVPRA